MTKFIYSESFPADVTFFTPGKRYELLDKCNDYRDGSYQAFVIGDDNKRHGPINVGWPCAYLDEKLWSVEDDEETPAV